MTTNSAYGAGEQNVSQPPSSAGGAVHYDDPLNANCSATVLGQTHHTRGCATDKYGYEYGNYALG